MSVTEQLLLTITPDTVPNAFAFTDQTGVALSTVITSNTITPTGYTGAAAWTCTGGTASIAGGAYTSSGTISPGQSVSLRLTSSASYSTQTSATFTISGISDTWFVTTVAADTTPDAFSFSNVSNAELSTLYTSNTITITGINSPTAVTSNASIIYINGISVPSGSTINNGQTLSVAGYSSGSLSTGTSYTVTVGGTGTTWTITTRALKTTPTWGSITPTINNATPNTYYYSDIIYVSNLEPNYTFTVSIATSNIVSGSLDAATSSLTGSYSASRNVTTDGSGNLVIRLRALTPADTSLYSGWVQVQVGNSTNTWYISNSTTYTPPAPTLNVVFTLNGVGALNGTVVPRTGTYIRIDFFWGSTGATSVQKGIETLPATSGNTTASGVNNYYDLNFYTADQVGSTITRTFTAYNSGGVGSSTSVSVYWVVGP